MIGVLYKYCLLNRSRSHASWPKHTSDIDEFASKVMSVIHMQYKSQTVLEKNGIVFKGDAGNCELSAWEKSWMMKNE